MIFLDTSQLGFFAFISIYFVLTHTHTLLVLILIWFLTWTSIESSIEECQFYEEILGNFTLSWDVAKEVIAYKQPHQFPVLLFVVRCHSCQVQGHAPQYPHDTQSTANDYYGLCLVPLTSCMFHSVYNARNFLTFVSCLSSQKISVGYMVAALCEIWLSCRTRREVSFLKSYYWHW